MALRRTWDSMHGYRLRKNLDTTIQETLSRLWKAKATLMEMKKDAFVEHEIYRLAGKIEGVALAISFLEEEERTNVRTNRQH